VAKRKEGAPTAYSADRKLHSGRERMGGDLLEKSLPMGEGVAKEKTPVLRRTRGRYPKKDPEAKFLTGKH